MNYHHDILWHRYAAHRLISVFIPWLRTACADACHGLSSHRPYGPFLATTVCKLSAFWCFATPSIIGRDSYTAPSHDNRCPAGHHFFIVCHSWHTSAALRCTRLRPNLRPTDAYAGCRVACLGCLCGMWRGVLGMPVRDVEWRACDACAVAAYIRQNCGGH